MCCSRYRSSSDQSVRGRRPEPPSRLDPRPRPDPHRRGSARIHLLGPAGGGRPHLPARVGRRPVHVDELVLAGLPLRRRLRRPTRTPTPAPEPTRAPTPLPAASPAPAPALPNAPTRRRDRPRTDHHPVPRARHPTRSGLPDHPGLVRGLGLDVRRHLGHWQNRFAASWARFLASHASELRMSTSRAVPDLDSYRVMRRNTAGIPHSLDAIERSRRFEVPAQIRRTR